MKERGSGHLGFVCSAAAQCAIWGYTAYGASKFALRGFVDSLHMELLPYGVGVSILYPPNTNTEGFEVRFLYFTRFFGIKDNAIQIFMNCSVHLNCLLGTFFYSMN